MVDTENNISIETVDNINVSEEMVFSVIGFLTSELKIETESLVIVFVDNNYIYRMNSEYLGHNYNTDIITFGYSENSYKVDGELYISVEEAERNAGLYGAGLNEEIIRLLIHGILHLIGLDDLEKSKKQKMKRIENYLLEKYLDKVRK